MPDLATMPRTNQCDLYRAAPLLSFPLDGRRHLVFLPLQESTVVVSEDELRLLLSLGELASIPAHAQGLRLDGTERLRELVERGVLISKDRLFAQTAKEPRSERLAIEWVVIPTCDRPRELGRALGALLRHLRAFDRSPKTLIADNSRDPAVRAMNRAALESAAPGYAGEIHYAGWEEKALFVHELVARSAVPPHVLQFCLFGTSGITPAMGANRNAILLRTHGSLVLSVDDDVVCRPGRARDLSSSDAIAIGTEVDPTEFWFFDDHSSAIDFVRWIEAGMLQAHEELLGKTLPELLSAFPGSQLAAPLTCPHVLLRLCRGQGQVRITYSGIVGDSGTYSADPVATSTNPGTRSRFSSTEADYCRATHSREVLRQAPWRAIGHIRPCLATCLGIDNRNLLPPFFPVCRNEDGQFGYLLERCSPESFAARLPIVVPHEPPSARSYETNILSTVRISDVVNACISMFQVTTDERSTAPALQSIGRHLMDLAGLGQRGFAEVLSIQLCHSVSERISRRVALLNRFGRHPAFWANDLQSQIDCACALMSNTKFLVPVDLGVPDPSVRSMELAGRFGELLYYWPAIDEATAALSDSGINLGIRIG